MIERFECCILSVKLNNVLFVVDTASSHTTGWPCYLFWQSWIFLKRTDTLLWFPFQKTSAKCLLMYFVRCCCCTWQMSAFYCFPLQRSCNPSGPPPINEKRARSLATNAAVSDKLSTFFSRFQLRAFSSSDGPFRWSACRPPDHAGKQAASGKQLGRESSRH